MGGREPAGTLLPIARSYRVARRMASCLVSAASTCGNEQGQITQRVLHCQVRKDGIFGTKQYGLFHHLVGGNVLISEPGEFGAQSG